MPHCPFLTADPIDAISLEQSFRSRESGAVVTFQEVVRRDRTEKGEIDYLFYEAYEAMAEKEIHAIKQKTESQWPGTEMVVQRRVGRVNAGETSVFVAVSAPERLKAFEACHFVIESMKSFVPIWKKDIYTNGSSQWTVCSHGAMLVSDEAIVMPES